MINKRILNWNTNIYPTYLDAGSQRHRDHVEDQMESLTLAFRAAEAVRDCDEDDEDRHNCGDVHRDQLI